MLSVVFSAYNEEESVRELCVRIREAMKEEGPYEIIAVNNASTDRTREELLAIPGLIVISLEDNRGQAAGLEAGIRVARGDIITTIDADLQNDPADIPLMLAKLRERYDAVLGWRRDRRDPLKRRLFSRFANIVAGVGTGFFFHDFSCGLRTFKKEYMRDVRLFGAMHVFLPAILKHNGARIAEMEVRHHPRKFGSSKYTLVRLSGMWLDLLRANVLYLHPFRFFRKSFFSRLTFPKVVETIETAN